MSTEKKTEHKLTPWMVQYDRESGVVMLRIRKRKPGEKHKRAGGQLYTKEVAPNWIVDFDGDGKPIELELLCPSKVFPAAILKILPHEFDPPTKARKRK